MNVEQSSLLSVWSFKCMMYSKCWIHVVCRKKGNNSWRLHVNLMHIYAAKFIKFFYLDIEYATISSKIVNLLHYYQMLDVYSE